ncbi:RCC1 domain-containing protein [Pseudomonas sp. LB3P14]
MLIQPPKNMSTLALIEPEVPDRTVPELPSGEWGINKAAAQGVFPDKGLQVHNAPWSIMGIGDKIEQLLNGNVVDQDLIDEATKVGQRVTMFVAPRHLQTGSYTLSYRVTRFNQQPETQTPPLKLYVKLDIPAGQDTDPGNGHSGLYMYIEPEIVNGGVDKDNAEDGVPIVIRAESGNGAPYENAAVGDLIILSWGGVFVIYGPLTAEQISDPANNPITILVDKATIEEAGDSDDSGLAVSFKVRDLVKNDSEDWCKETRIRVSTQTDLRSAPIAKDALNNVLNLDDLGDKAVTVQVAATSPSFKLGDIINLNMRGTTSDGDSVEVAGKPAPVDNLPHVYEIDLEKSDVRKLVKTQGVFSYHLDRIGSAPLRSKGQFVQIEGQAKQLAAPIADDAVGGSLPPDLASTRIRIAHDSSIKVDMAIELKWLGTRPNGSVHDPELPWYFPDRSEVADPKGFVITVGGEHLKTIEGGQLVLSYKLLIDDNGDIIELVSRSASSLNVGDPKFELIKPTVDGEKDGALEPEDLPNGVSILTAPRPTGTPSKAKDVVTYFWEGKVSGKTQDEVTLNALSANRDVKYNLNAKFVADHMEPNRGTSVTAWYQIWRFETNTTSHSNPLTFVIGEAQQQPLDQAEVVEAIDNVLDPADAPNGATVRMPANRPENVNDKYLMQWLTEDGETEHKDEKTVSEENKGEPVECNIPRSIVLASQGKSVTVSYVVEPAEGGEFPAEDYELTVKKQAQPLLDQAEVVEALEGVLDPANAPDGATVRIPANRPENAGDHFYMKWATTDGVTEHEDDKSITGNMKGKPVEFTVPVEIVRASLNKNVIVSYRVALFEGGDDAEGEDYPLKVEKQEFTLPDATFKEATGAQKDQLNPDNVFPGGATVVIPAEAQLKEGDVVTATVDGQTTTYHPHTVSKLEEDTELSEIKVAHAIILANDGKSIALSYEVKRKAGGTDGPSGLTEYDVRKVIGSGLLRVMGARYNRSTYRESSSSRLLSAFNAITSQPVQAEWKYADENTWTKAATWSDTAPHKPLQVRTTDDQVTLNRVNIFGNGVDTTITGSAAFVALRDKDNMVAWGNPLFGARIPPTFITFDDIIYIACSGSSYAVIRANNTTVAWSDTVGQGGDMTGIDPFDFVQLVGNALAIAGRKKDGTVHAWGTAASGATLTPEIESLTNVVEVFSAGQAFAVLLATGEVKAWGAGAEFGSDVPPEIASLNDIKRVMGNGHAFAALRKNGTVVAWGSTTLGGTVSDPVASLTDINELACANAQAFAALRDTKEVVAWGADAYGGTVPTVIASLTDIISVVATWNSLAAIRANGHVVAWPDTNPAGLVPDAIAARNDIVQLAGSSHAFAVLFKDGTVEAWGDATVGGDTALVADKLVKVVALYDNSHGFAAITSDGEVVTWGHAVGGGDSSLVQDRLKGQVSYLATPASRGRALKASRLAKLNNPSKTPV